jgi:hypothetical protein
MVECAILLVLKHLNGGMHLNFGVKKDVISQKEDKVIPY